MREHENEPIPGLPEALPAGERILWQGAPDWRALARRALHVYKVAIYCLVLLAWNGTAAVTGGATVAEALVHTLWILPLPLIAVGILLTLGWLYAKSTVYTVTNRRLVVRSGVALPLTINLPFRVIDSASLKVHGDGTGDVPFALKPGNRVAFIQLWPNVRPWHVNHPQPMLRCIPEPEVAARIVADALRDYVAEHGETRRNPGMATPLARSNELTPHAPGHPLPSAGR